MINIVHEVLTNLRAGNVCMLPTDSIPGLVFDPRSEIALYKVEQLKLRTPGRGFVSLVSSLDKALQFWEPLDDTWTKALSTLWPGPLTVIHKAKQESLATVNRELALRVPTFRHSYVDWMQLVLQNFPVPLATTSVNESGQQHARDWAEAVHWCSGKGIYFPLLKAAPPSIGSASTIVRLVPDGWELVRQGPVSAHDISQVLHSTKSSAQDQSQEDSSTS